MVLFLLFLIPSVPYLSEQREKQVLRKKLSNVQYSLRVTEGADQGRAGSSVV